MQTGFWPLYEIINGRFELSKNSKRFLDSSKRKPIEDYLSIQKRFRNISSKDIQNYREYINNLWKEIEVRLEEHK